MKITSFSATLLSKKTLSDKTYEFTYSCPEDFTFIPGQFVTFTFPGNKVRAYSIVKKNKSELIFLINTNPGGVASLYFENTKTGDVLPAKGPFGIFQVKPTNFEKIFICTSSGVAPFIPMIQQILNSKDNILLRLYFGERYLEDDYVSRYIENFFKLPNFKFVRCITREDPAVITPLLDNNKNPYTIAGRVTKALLEENIDWQTSEFYLCGSKLMINDASELLKTLGATKIYTEKFD